MTATGNKTGEIRGHKIQELAMVVSICNPAFGMLKLGYEFEDSLGQMNLDSKLKQRRIKRSATSLPRRAMETKQTPKTARCSGPLDHTALCALTCLVLQNLVKPLQ